MDTAKEKTLKEEINESFDDEYINNFGKLVYSAAEKFCEKEQLKGKIYLEENILEYCLIDILVDIARLKYFHDIDNVNYVKIISYTASWWIRRKPFQIIQDSGFDNIYINEKFAFSLLLQASECLETEKKYCEEDEEEFVKQLKHVSYHLKYRNTNPQTLELLLMGIKLGQTVH